MSHNSGRAHDRLVNTGRKVVSGRLPSIRCDNARFVQRRNEASSPRHSCHFSALSRGSRQSIVLIQRLLPYFPPDISAANLHNLRKL